MPTGRPLKFQSVKELREKIDAYFKNCDVIEEPYTITGLAVALDTSRKVLVEYEDKEEFSNTIKAAKDKCEKQIEVMALKGKFNPAFSIFNLKNNYGWKDKTEADQNVNVKGNLTIERTLYGENKTAPQLSTEALPITTPSSN